MTFDELWRAERRAKKGKERLEKQYAPLIEAARKAKKQEEYDRLVSQYLSELDFYDEPKCIRTNRLIKRARPLGVSIPPKPSLDSEHLYENENWCFNQTTCNFYLTDEAESRITREVRKEETEKLQHQMRWVSIVIVPTIGAIGAIMGLISLIHALFFRK